MEDSKVERLKQLEKELISDGILLYKDLINKNKKQMYFHLRPGNQIKVMIKRKWMNIYDYLEN